jgi:hypothetical protein
MTVREFPGANYTRTLLIVYFLSFFPPLYIWVLIINYDKLRIKNQFKRSF